MGFSLLEELQQVCMVVSAMAPSALASGPLVVQVYDGSHANWREDEACHPVNTYGCTKVEAEKAIQVPAAQLLVLRWH